VPNPSREHGADTLRAFNPQFRHHFTLLKSGWSADLRCASAISAIVREQMQIYASRHGFVASIVRMQMIAAVVSSQKPIRARWIA
jgi:hypothetical protein